MGRSLYLDDERQDVTDDLFYAFASARSGDWDEAGWSFKQARDKIEELIRLMEAVENGQIDPNIKEGLAHPDPRIDQWWTVEELVGDE